MPDYRPHYKGADDPTGHVAPPEDPNYRQSIVIMPNPPAGPGWRIVWDKDPAGDHEEHIAPTRDEAIAWAKARCEYIRAWDDADQDLVEIP
jgi:hypothetical protein